ncbi:MAG: NUDIX domain-containing protein [Lautropia sp.]|nr:NUDIX domain-containing protein [Lautropia sp.]
MDSQPGSAVPKQNPGASAPSIESRTPRDSAAPDPHVGPPSSPTGSAKRRLALPYARIRMAPALLDSSLDEIPPGFVPLWFHNQRIGAVCPRWIPHLDPRLFELDIDGARSRVRMAAVDRRAGQAPEAARFDARLHDWASALKSRGLLPGWRDEKVEIFGASPDAPLFTVERALLRPLGLLLRTVQVNVFTFTAGAIRVWSARRSPNKTVDPGLLDSLVSGGIGHDETPLEAMFREAAEEAGMERQLSRCALPSGIMDSSSVCHDGFSHLLHRERMHVFDLQVPPDFMPTHPDRETESSALLDPDTLMTQIKQGLWTREGAWASLNLIQRHRSGKLRCR